MQPILNIAIAAARSAGDIILRYFAQRDRIKICTKENDEFFSEVDLQAEQAIINTIHKAYPNHAILAEESGKKNSGSESVWIIDPLDGTTNFLHGFPFFCVSIAHCVKGRLENAVIFDPMHQECFIASRGCGARLNEHRIRVSKQSQLDLALIGSGFALRNTYTAERFLPTFSKFFGKCAGIRRVGSAALDLAYLACGRLDGVWEFGLRPWDLAAGALIIKEAGGLISDLQGEDSYLQSGDLVAGNPKIHKALLEIMQKAPASQ